MSSIEVMETPDKSENDKKLYRVIRFENGLKALLISDPTQMVVTDETVVTERELKHRHEAAAVSEDDDDDDEETDSEQSDDEESEDNGHKEKRSKLAACSLCVDVGSFSDPREVQGLAHFLGKINIFLLLH